MGKLPNLGRPSLVRVLVCSYAGLLVSAPARADEPVVLRAALAEKQVLRYDVEAQLQVKGSKEPESVEQNLRLRLTVAHADKEGALVRCRVESARVRAQGRGPAAGEFEWKEGDGPGAEDEPELAQVYRRLGGTVLELSLDERGAVKSVSGLDRVATGAGDARALGVLAPESAGRMLQGLFTMDPDGKPRSPGQSWSFTQEVPAGVWKASASTEYALDGLAGDVATVSGITTLTPREPGPDQAETAPRLEVTAQSIKTDARWDTRLGRLVRRQTVGSVEMRSTLPLKQPITATTTSTSRIVFTLVAEGPEK